jgi:UDP-3-O-[3-hydroxymyristoyl] N-acetylglucosamine deacetylase
LGKAPDRSVATVEHLMAALYALGVDNISIDLDGSEVPIMDGSAAVFIDAIDNAGLVNHSVKRRYIRVIKPVRIEMGGSWAEFTPHNGTRFEIDIDFETPLIGRQTWKGEVTADSFRRELARARTFGFMRDVERLWASGHALGSSLENSVVIGDDDKVINVEGLRFRDEFVRHKTLDAVGDLALAGAQFIGCYRSYRGGHKLNALALRAHCWLILLLTKSWKLRRGATRFVMVNWLLSTLLPLHLGRFDPQDLLQRRAQNHGQLRFFRA